MFLLLAAQLLSTASVSKDHETLRTLVINAGSTSSRGTIFEYDRSRVGLPVRLLPLTVKAQPGLHAIAVHDVSRTMAGLARAAEATRENWLPIQRHLAAAHFTRFIELGPRGALERLPM